MMLLFLHFGGKNKVYIFGAYALLSMILGRTYDNLVLESQAYETISTSYALKSKPGSFIYCLEVLPIDP
jgi:hypothetical protein